MGNKEKTQDIRNLINTVKYLQESTVTEFGRYIIKNYDPVNSAEDKKYLDEHAGEIWSFLDNGYKNATNSGFLSCGKIRDLRNNANFFKIAFSEDGQYIAVSVYTGYQFGKKCVGITATTDENLRDLGKEAVNAIIREDTSHPLDFFWCECSGAVEYLYEKNNGIKIRNKFVNLFLKNPIDNDKLSSDGYHYTRTLYNGEDVYKVIFGFNRQETFDIIYEQCKNEIDQRLEKSKNDSKNDIKLLKENEKDKYNVDIEYADYVLSDFWTLCEYGGYCEFPQYFLDLVSHSILVLKMNRNYDPLFEREIPFYEKILNRVTPLECHHYVGTEAIDNNYTEKLVAEQKK